jgi:hypothetical protein
VRKGEALVSQRRSKGDTGPQGGGDASPPAEELRCGCGQVLNPSWRLCPHCGTPTPRGPGAPVPG